MGKQYCPKTVTDIFKNERQRMFSHDGIPITDYYFWIRMPHNIVYLHTREEIDTVFCILHHFYTPNSSIKRSYENALRDLEQNGYVGVEYFGDIFFWYRNKEEVSDACHITPKPINHIYDSLADAIAAHDIGAFVMAEARDNLEENYGTLPHIPPWEIGYFYGSILPWPEGVMEFNAFEHLAAEIAKLKAKGPADPQFVGPLLG